MQRNKISMFIGSLIPAGVVAVCGWIGSLSVAVWLPVLLLQLVWCLTESICVTRFRGAAVAESVIGDRQWLPILAGIGAAVTMLVATIDGLIIRDAHFWKLTVLGCAIGITGVALRLLAIRQLGPMFLDQVALLPGHQIDTSGIYRCCRHPAEIGFLLGVLGHVVMCGSLFGLVLFLLWMLPLSIYRIRQENLLINAYVNR